MKQQHIVLYDGHCNLCSSSVEFIVQRDYRNLYTLIPLQSKEGQAKLQQYNLPLNNFNTVVLLQNDEVYTASTAALMIVKNLSGVVYYLHIFIVVPVVLRDFIYKLIAKSRYKLLGKSESCRVYP